MRLAARWQGSQREKSDADGQWSQAVEMDPGELGSAPAVAVKADGEQDVFWEGTNGHLRETWYAGAWQGPVDRGARGLGSAPGVGVAAVGTQSLP